MPIEPAHLARSLGALDTVDLAQGLARTLQQVLRSAKTLLDADRVDRGRVDGGPQCLFCGEPARAFKPLDQGSLATLKRLW
jgi:hypothetical protein